MVVIFGKKCKIMSCPIQQIKPHVVALVQVGVIRYSFLNIRLKKEAKYFLVCIKRLVGKAQFLQIMLLIFTTQEMENRTAVSCYNFQGHVSKQGHFSQLTISSKSWPLNVTD
jgi:hypothetical protein